MSDPQVTELDKLLQMQMTTGGAEGQLPSAEPVEGEVCWSVWYDNHAPTREQWHHASKWHFHCVDFFGEWHTSQATDDNYSKKKTIVKKHQLTTMFLTITALQRNNHSTEVFRFFLQLNLRHILWQVKDSVVLLKHL